MQSREVRLSRKIHDLEIGGSNPSLCDCCTELKKPHITPILIKRRKVVEVYAYDKRNLETVVLQRH